MNEAAEQSLDALGIKYGTDKSSKGHDYLSNYEQFLKGLRHEQFNLIEIGGLNGASLKMWRDYFANSRIICLDIKPEIKQFEEDRIKVEIGNAGQAAFLKNVRQKYEKAKIILDDGSHRWDHMRTAFRHLYPMVEPGGFYVVEDIHSNYEGRYAGVDDLPFVQSLYSIVDVMNARGDARRLMAKTMPPSLVAAAIATEYVCFIGRSCLLKKKGTPPERTESGLDG